MSEIVETALRQMLDELPKKGRPIKLRQFDLGLLPVDIADREALESFLAAKP